MKHKGPRRTYLTPWAIPDEKMGTHGKRKRAWTTVENQFLKRETSRKRRARDRKEADADS